MPKEALDGVSNDQARELRCKSDPELSEGDQWYAIWHILFGNLPKPYSPFMDMEQSRDYCEFVDFCQRRGADIIAQEVANHFDALAATPQAILLAQLNGLVRTGFRSVFEQFRSPQSGSQTPDLLVSFAGPTADSAGLNTRAPELSLRDQPPGFELGAYENLWVDDYDTTQWTTPAPVQDEGTGQLLALEDFVSTERDLNVSQAQLSSDKTWMTKEGIPRRWDI
ncbi:hypothetical protein OQA88_8011 [Cercophora sp. LCS_1]